MIDGHGVQTLETSCIRALLIYWLIDPVKTSASRSVTVILYNPAQAALFIKTVINTYPNK